MKELVGSCGRGARALFLSLCTLPLVTSVAYAQEEKEKESVASADTGLGLTPGTPVVATLPGGIGPSYGKKPASEQDYSFDFHGLITMPLRLGLNQREGFVTTEQKNLVLHAPPVVPDYRDSFAGTSVVPQPYAQLAFSYGNSIVTGTAIIKAWTATTAASFFDPTLQGGITDAFITFNLPKLAKNTYLAINVGAFSNRYGTMGEYDEGRYGTAIIGRTNGVGENVVARLALGNVVLSFEQGFQAQLDKPPIGLTTDGWNGFADPNTGTSLVMHEHLGLTYRRQLTLGLHHMRAWSQDDRASQAFTPDGTITVLGADMRFSASHLGHVYVGASYTDATDARSVGRILSVMNTQGGPDLMRNYLGPNSGGTGKLITLGAEYSVSLARLRLHPRDYDGKSRDIILSAFGIYSHVTSDDPAYNGDHKVKFGAEGTYTLASFFAASLRLDHVRPTSNVDGREFSIISPRLIFRTDWQSRNQVVLQYSRFVYGSNPLVRSGYPAVDDPMLTPDADVISISGSMWW
ncbi:hypothetical protein [Polyangium jinanense]|uniref:Porin n=1 Tax=Polyangium jinanense TaxID=2829994 RepID=A0A9X3WZY8_9BACT|nr:hypothetical protein [Polyangium jinanense]MDC3955236.1 hypothetical protein [Polyangium jinanense]MDC3981537.1 hypothetical protein [Polyangium jinanense]